MTEYNNDETHIHVVLVKGTMVSHYRIIEKIGAGGMGEVYLAEDTKLKRNVALKFLPSHMCDDNGCRSRFKREAQAVAKLNHPNIITIYEVSDFNDRPFFAMELIEGKTLRDLAKENDLSVDRIIELALQICDGLSAAHDKKIVHRDIKPSNIVIDAYGRPKILDFGLAAIQGGEQLTKTGSTMGTICYMSPEQAKGEDVDHRTDIFSLGVVLYELIAGQSPFTANNDAATINNVITREPEPLVTHNPEAPGQLEQIVAMCLQKNSNKRYQTANDITNDLQRLKTALVNKNPADNPIENDATIAVLPFANISADPENEFFADGLTEELLNVLAKNPQLKVTGRTSSFAFKNKQEDLRDIGNKLGVNSILEGSVRKSGNRVRITAQLIKTSDGFHLWSETYDRVVEDIFAVQDEISEAVAKELQVTLLGKSKEKKLVNIESYEFLLKAQQVAISWSESASFHAIELYQKAIDIEPDYARAYAGIARVYMLQAGYGFDDHEKAYRKAKAFALKAIEFDDKLADAYEVLGWIRCALEFHFDEAEIALQKAYDLAPNNSRMVSSLGLFKGFMGNFDESIRLLAHALEIDPLNPEAYLNVGRIRHSNKQYDEALIAMQKALELSKSMAGLYAGISGIHYIQGNFEKALEFAKLEISKGHRLYALAIAYYGLGMKKESDSAINELIEISHRNAWAFQFALIYAERNELNEAFKWLEIAFNFRDAGICQMKVATNLKNLHSDPRWPLLLKKIGFSE